jgi:NAD(P)-dependent dehydrogenase (short-subunit alcohol dehydrogenase family)
MSYTLEDSIRLDGKTAIVTGAGGGIGLAVAKTYLKAGARCVLSDVASAPNTNLGRLLDKNPDRAIYQAADVADLDDIADLVGSAAQWAGSIDILFNNAAVFDMAPLLESDADMYRKIFDVNVKGAFFMLQAVAQSMVDLGRKGRIINMASQAGRRGEALVAHYCASKAAVISYTQSAALALAQHGICVNAISPGVIDTPMWEHVDALFARYEGRQPGEKKRLVGQDVPLGHMGTPDDICGMALFLAAPGSSYITAQTFNVDGGNVMS